MGKTAKTVCRADHCRGGPSTASELSETAGPECADVFEVSWAGDVQGYSMTHPQQYLENLGSHAEGHRNGEDEGDEPSPTPRRRM